MSIDYDPFAEAVREDPHPYYRRLRAEAPAYYMEKYDAWAVSRFRDVWELSARADLSAARGTAPAQILTREQPVTPMINVLDPPEHTKLRSVIRHCFLPAQVRGVEPVAGKIVDELLDALQERDEFDAVGDFAARLSVTVACMAIGLPVEDGPMLTRLVQRFFHHDPDSGGMTEEGLRALGELDAYCEQKVKERRRSPTDSPVALDALARFDPGSGPYDDRAAASHVSMLVIGGSETFPKVLANGLRRLREHPDQRAALAADPAKIPAAFNEILRYDMPTQMLGRTATKDFELHGEKVRAGQAVMFLYASANHDEREFAAPERFDVERNPARILSFGAGNHQCLGTHVARMEGKVCLERILARFPEYEIDLARAERHRTEFVQGFASFPIRIR
ncbi:MAG: cytochrome P450 [Myxococcota bacterium]